MRKTIALVMVVKNEEKGLEKAILSCKDFVNEIIIAVDNESTDRTLEIAKKYATTLKTFDWRDDFAWARNFAHEGVKTDWLFFLDGHEYVENCENLIDYLDKPVDGLLVRIRMETGAEFYNPRIYKNGFQFYGQVHEKINCETVALYPNFIIQHDRLGGQDLKSAEIREKQRDDQIPRIMGAEVKKNPANIRASFHLVLYYLSKLDLKKALKYQKLYLKYSKLSGERYYILFSRALTLLTKKKLFRAFWFVNKADLEEPMRWETEKLKGIILFEGKKYEKALEHFVNSFNSNVKNHIYVPWKRDDAGTWNLIGECFYRRGVYSKASTAFLTASNQAKEIKEKDFFRERSLLMREMMRS